MVIGFAVAVVLGSLVYCSVFMAASVFTNHSLIGGLIYVFLWEGVMTRLFTGTRYMSVRQYTLGLADLIADTSRRVFEADLNGITALVLMAIVGTAGDRFRRAPSEPLRDERQRLAGDAPGPVSNRPA